MRTISALFVLLLVAACQAPTYDLTDADITAINAVVEAYRTAALAGDGDAWAATWAEDGVFMLPGRPVLEGKAALRAIWDEGAPAPSEFSLSVHDIEGLGHWARVRGAYRYTTAATEGMPEQSDAGKFLWAFEKQADGAWLIETVCHNSDSPPPPPPEG